MTARASFVVFVWCLRHRLGSVVVFDFNGACDLFCLVGLPFAMLLFAFRYSFCIAFLRLSATYYDTPSTRPIDYPVAEALRSEATRLSTVDLRRRTTDYMYICIACSTAESVFDLGCSWPCMKEKACTTSRFCSVRAGVSLRRPASSCVPLGRLPSFRATDVTSVLLLLPAVCFMLLLLFVLHMLGTGIHVWSVLGCSTPVPISSISWHIGNKTRGPPPHHLFMIPLDSLLEVMFMRIGG